MQRLTRGDIQRLIVNLHGKKKTKPPPLKYFMGLLDARSVRDRYARIMSPVRRYTPFKTDKGIRTRQSTHTKKFYLKHPGARSLAAKSQATGVPLSIIKDVYNRGLAAWKTGHRPGATGQQWGYARVHSFLTMGKTAFTADIDLVRKAKKTMKKRDVSKWLKKR